MTNRLSTGVFIGHCPLRNVNYDVVSVCEMKTIFRNRSDPTAYSSAPGHTGKIRRPKIKGLSVIPSTRDLFPNQPKVSHVRLRFKAAHSLPPRKKRR